MDSSLGITDPSYGINGSGYDSLFERPQEPHRSGSMSGGSSGASHGSWAGRRGRKRCKVEPLEQRQDDDTYQCTWCYKGFTRKDSWKRHEESEHCPVGEYVCMINGPTDFYQDKSICLFCSCLDPSAEHLKSHRVDKCLCRSENERSFARLDSLQQHIKQMHPNAINTVHLSKFYRRLEPDRSALWCGFCKTELTDWNVRIQHVAKHITSGLDMSSWIPKTPATASGPPVFDQGLSSLPLADPSSLASLQVEGFTSKEVPNSLMAIDVEMSGDIEAPRERADDANSPMAIDNEVSDDIQALRKEVEVALPGEATARSRFWKTRRKEIFKKQNYFSKRRLYFYQMEQECSRDIIRLEGEIGKIDNTFSSQDSSSQMKRFVGQIRDLRKEDIIAASWPTFADYSMMLVLACTAYVRFTLPREHVLSRGAFQSTDQQ